MGLTALDTTSNATVKQEKNTGVKVGVGYERFLTDEWSTRIAYQQFSGDAGLLSVGINRHFDRITSMKKTKKPSFK